MYLLIQTYFPIQKSIEIIFSNSTFLFCCREHRCDRSSGGGPENRQTKEHSETGL